ncbi:haloalkane dehalogenase [Longibacter salinarum]|uniref:Haloalkane dehalogenase n=2 Tax=Longibacter salinarum TaxID=1850348 RepID=A0A2A8CWK4_9BACT|nr:haloalkane dehalogenase [Longibacter salinarum]
MNSAFPYPTSYFQTEAGRMAYTDIGHGPPIVCLHGNPTWAFMYRHLLRDLSNTHRCIAPDYLGFGRSDKPTGASYRPPAQAARIEAFLQHLELEPLTMVVHDWGGPIGLSYALRHPERIARLVITNSWLWPHDKDPWVGSFSRFVGGPIGRVLIRRFNVFAELGLRLGTTRPLSKDVLRAYTSPLDTPERRMPSWEFPRALLAETDWLRSLWTNRSRLRDIDAIIVWGRRDPAFGSTRYLERWTRLLPHARVHETDASHYVAEDLGPRLSDMVLHEER